MVAGQHRAADQVIGYASQAVDVARIGIGLASHLLGSHEGRSAADLSLHRVFRTRLPMGGREPEPTISTFTGFYLES